MPPNFVQQQQASSAIQLSSIAAPTPWLLFLPIPHHSG